MLPWSMERWIILEAGSWWGHKRCSRMDVRLRVREEPPVRTQTRVGEKGGARLPRAPERRRW